MGKTRLLGKEIQKMEMTKVLIRLAEYSPKEYAKQIRRRNESLLKKLMLLKPYVGRTIGEVPDNILKIVLVYTNYGCPHCDNCKACLWNTTRVDKRHQGCMGAMFDHLSMDNIRYLKSINICYGMRGEGFVVAGCFDFHDLCNKEIQNLILKKSDWGKCVRFVRAHIEWAKLDCWGKHYSAKKS